VSPVKYELGFYIPEASFFIVTAVKTSNLTYSVYFLMYTFPLLMWRLCVTPKHLWTRAVPYEATSLQIVLLVDIVLRSVNPRTHH
jgi:hypothetical protein